MIPGSPNEFSVPAMPPDAALLMPSTPMMDAVPMIMPSIVSTDRTRLRQIASSASPA
jgi:hypothetical protein